MRVVGATSRDIAGPARTCIRGIDRPHARSNAAIAAITDVAAPLPRLTVTRPGLACVYFKRPDETIGEILHMHVVAHTGAVRRVPVVAVDDQLARLARRDAAQLRE